MNSNHMNGIIDCSEVEVSERYCNLIRNLHDDKVEINEKKLKHLGKLDIDDHGFIDYPEFSFEPECCDDGLVHGGALIGRNFMRFLELMPEYINRNSALAGCWIGNLSRWIPFGIADEDRPHELDSVIEKYKIRQTGFGGMNHLCPDLEIGLNLGWNGLLEKIRHYREVNRPLNSSFYDGEEMLVSGIFSWVQAHICLAERLAEKEEDPFHRENYLSIAKANRNLLTGPPGNFREACQFLAHFQTVDRMYFVGGALGSIDCLLKPYFEKDMAEGLLTEEEAVWMIASLLFHDTHYSQIGGISPAGDRDLTSRISFIILEAMHLLKIPANLAVRVHEPLPGQDRAAEVLLHRALEYTLADGHGVSYSLEKGIAEGYAKNGYPLELGRMRVKCGCNWAAIPGREYPLQDVTRLNMAMALHYAICDMEADRENSLEHLWQLWCHHLDVMISCIKAGYDRHYEVMERNLPEIVLNLFMHGPIERGLNCANGGVDILNLNIDGIGLATAADSFAAIEQRVVQEKRLTWEELYSLLRTDYAGKERERLMLKNIKRFGTPGSGAEKWAVRIRDEFVRQCRKSPTPKHHLPIIPGMFSHGDVVMYGNDLAATPNGRNKGEPISHSTEPDPGFARGVDTFSPVLKARAVAKTQPGYGNSAPLQLDIDTGLAAGSGGADALAALIHAHEQESGTLINLNCMSKEALLEAHANPKSHPDLVVRVTGYSAFFSSLSKEYRQQVVDRLLEGD